MTKAIAVTAMLVLMGTAGGRPQAPAAPIVLWPDGAPGALGRAPEDVPDLTPYLPPRDRATGAAVIVCPGGSYARLADHEGRPVAEWLNTLGVAGFVLKYRLGPRYHHPAPFADVTRAMRLVRARAGAWGIDPKRIGVLGFSAGGHLASTIATHFDVGVADVLDPIDRPSSRPDLVILIYPVITMGPGGHQGSRTNLLGAQPDPRLVEELSNEKHVTSDTPPAFLVHTVADTAVRYENSLLFAAALRKAGVPHELHVYEQGRHGFGLGTGDPILSTWPARCADWLRAHGFAR